MGRYCSYLLPKQLHVNMSEDSEADEDDDAYSQLDGVKLYKEASSAAMDNDQEEMEAATAPKLSSSSIGGHEAHAQAHAQVSVLRGAGEEPGKLRLNALNIKYIKCKAYQNHWHYNRYLTLYPIIITVRKSGPHES